MANILETCGCVSNDTHWIKLCAVHLEERAASKQRSDIDSLRWLMAHYDRFPNEDNLYHVVKRIREVGSAIALDPTCTAWVRGHAALVIKAGHAGNLRRP